MCYRKSNARLKLENKLNWKTHTKKACKKGNYNRALRKKNRCLPGNAIQALNKKTD